MDIRCVKCGEPWDMDCLHEEISYRGETGELAVPAFPGTTVGKAYDDYRKAYDALYRKVSGEFRAKGCEALTAYSPAFCTPRSGFVNAATFAAYELCGDDMDGAAALIEDFLL